MNTNIYSGFRKRFSPRISGRFLALNLVKSSRGGGGQDALFKAFLASTTNFVRAAVHVNSFLRPR